MVSGTNNFAHAYQNLSDFMRRAGVDDSTIPQSILKAEKDQNAKILLPDSAAAKIEAHVTGLNGQERLEAEALLATFRDRFEVKGGDQKWQAFLTKQLGVPAQAKGRVRSVNDFRQEIAAGKFTLDAQTISDLRVAFQNNPKEVQDFVLFAMSQGVKNGTIKMDPAARSAFVRQFAAANTDGTLDHLAARFGDKFAASVDPKMLDILGNPPTFEELIFILLITVTKNSQKEMLDDQAEMQGQNDADSKAAQRREERKQGEIAAARTIREGVASAASAPIDDSQFAAAQHQAFQTEAKLGAMVDRLGEKKGGYAASIDRMFPLGHPARETVGNIVGTALKGKQMDADRAALLDWAMEAAGRQSASEFPDGTPVANSQLGQALSGADTIVERFGGALADVVLDRSNPAKANSFAPIIQTIVSGGIDPSAISADARGAAQLQAIHFAAGNAASFNLEARLNHATKGLPKSTAEAVKNAMRDAFATLPNNRRATSDECKNAYVAARDALVQKAMHGSSADVRAAENKLVGGAIDDAIVAANSQIKNIEDGGQTVDAPQKQSILQDKLAAAKDKLLNEADGHGLNPNQRQGLQALFDAAAAKPRTDMQTHGAVAPLNDQGTGKSDDPTESNDTRSRQLMFEKLKFKMNMLTEMMQAMGAILNTMHQQAETTIREMKR